MTAPHQLSPLDASFLALETDEAHMHIGGIAIFTPPKGKQSRSMYNVVFETIRHRISRMPRYRQRLATVPFNLGQPYWVDDPEFDLRHHLLRAHLDAPGDMDALLDLSGQVFSEPLDRTRPLWQMVIVDGLSNHRWALISKNHHSLVDGKSNLELASVLFDLDPTPPPHERIAPWKPAPLPSATSLVTASLKTSLRAPQELLERFNHAVLHPDEVTQSLQATADGLYSLRNDIRPPSSPFNGDTSPTRTVATCSFPLLTFKAIRQQLGGTINDVVLAIVAGGLRDYFLDVGWSFEDVDHLTALCPVSLRDEAERQAMGNKLAMLFVPLPISIADPKRRYEEIRRVVDERKALQQAAAADLLLNLAGRAPAPLQQRVAQTSIQMMNFNLMVTNVPGPQFPLYLQGSRLNEIYPLAFLYDRQLLSIAVFSYDGEITFGILGDAESSISYDHLAEACTESAKQLLALVD